MGIGLPSAAHFGNGLQAVPTQCYSRNKPEPGGRNGKISGAQPPVYFFGYPTDWARIIFCPGLSFSSFASASRSIPARTTVASPSEAQKR